MVRNKLTPSRHPENKQCIARGILESICAEDGASDDMGPRDEEGHIDARSTLQCQRNILREHVNTTLRGDGMKKGQGIREPGLVAAKAQTALPICFPVMLIMIR